MYYIFDMIYKVADAAGASTTGKEVLAAIRDFFPMPY